MSCKRDKLTGIVACFVNEIADYDHGGAQDLENLPATMNKDVKGKQPPVRVKKQADEVGLHTAVKKGKRGISIDDVGVRGMNDLLIPGHWG